jgi:hypothetical protein
MSRRLASSACGARLPASEPDHARNCGGVRCRQKEYRRRALHTPFKRQHSYNGRNVKLSRDDGAFLTTGLHWRRLKGKNMRTAIMAAALMTLVLGGSNAEAKMACPPGSSAATKMCRLDQLGDLCQPKGICGTEAVGDHLLGESPSKFSPEVVEAIKEGSALAGVDPEMMAKLVYSKSGGNPNAVVGNRKGLMLLTEEEMRRVSSGEGNVFDPRDSVMAVGTIMKQKTASPPKRPHFDPEGIRRGLAIKTTRGRKGKTRATG